jgi:hypothetical protein
VQVAPRATRAEQELGEAVNAGLLAVAGRPGHGQGPAAPGHPGCEHDRREPAAVVDMHVGEQHGVDLDRVDAGATEPFEGAAAGVDQDPGPAVKPQQVARRRAAWVHERPPAAQHGDGEACGRRSGIRGHDRDYPSGGDANGLRSVPHRPNAQPPGSPVDGSSPAETRTSQHRARRRMLPRCRVTGASDRVVTSGS